MCTGGRDVSVRITSLPLLLGEFVKLMTPSAPTVL